jgi:glyoxylate/hydroxypyruvate reductase A
VPESAAAELSEPDCVLMPAILLAVTGLDPQPWEERMRALAPQRDIRLWPHRLGDHADIAYVCAWHAPRGLFARLPRLQAIFSLGAGVDHVIADPDLPDVPVVRIVDPDLTMRMTEYVALHVLMQYDCRVIRANPFQTFFAAKAAFRP